MLDNKYMCYTEQIKVHVCNISTVSPPWMRKSERPHGKQRYHTKVPQIKTTKTEQAIKEQTINILQKKYDIIMKINITSEII